MPALHRHADHLADADADDALAGGEALVAGRVGDEHALLLAQDVVDDGAADGDQVLRPAAVLLFANGAAFGSSAAGVGVPAA